MKSILVSIFVVMVLFGGVVLLTRKGSNFESNSNVAPNNVSIVNGKQIIQIRAKGGYQPRKSIAKAEVPTILRFDTNGTFDCSSAVRIPSLNIGKNLPASGSTDIELGNPKLGTLQGTCAMGMYPFEIEFQG